MDGIHDMGGMQGYGAAPAVDRDEPVFGVLPLLRVARLVHGLLRPRTAREREALSRVDKMLETARSVR